MFIYKIVIVNHFIISVHLTSVLLMDM